MLYSFSRFIIQLRSFRKMIEDTEIETDEQPNKITLETLASIIIDRKFVDYYTDNQQTDCTEEEKRLNAVIIEVSNNLMEKHTIAKKLYDMIYVVNNDGALTLESTSPGTLSYFLGLLSRSDNLSKYHKDDLLFQSLAISVCSALENLSSEFLKEIFFNHHKGDLVDAKEISFKMMSEFDSIDAVRLYLIDKEIEGTFRKSFSDWSENLDKYIHVYSKFPEAKPLKDSICELFQRRNLYVHANGIVNKRYLEVVEVTYREKLCEGDALIISREYLENKLSEVESLGWFMFYAYLEKYEKNELWFTRINDKIVAELSSGNNAIPVIYKKIMENKNLSESDRLYSSINYYLFYHVNDRIDEVRNDLEKFDVSVYSIEYKMAKAILLNSENKHDIVKSFFETLEDEGDFLFCFDWPLMNSVKKEEPSRSYFEKRLSEIFEVNFNEERMDNEEVS